MPLEERAELALESYQHMGMAIAETAYLWFRDIADLDPLFTLEGREHLDAALAKGNGVILLQAHFTTIDVCSNAMGSRWPISAVYDSPKNPLYADFLLKARSQYMNGMIDNRDIRNMIRRLRKGEIVWYSPDQTVHRKNGGITTNYFNVPVLTSSGTARIVAMTGATIVPYVPTRSPKGGAYTLRFMAPMPLDCSDVETATQTVNDHLEAQVRTQPAQYLWAHKRFKPPGPEHPDPYKSTTKAG